MTVIIRFQAASFDEHCRTSAVFSFVRPWVFFSHLVVVWCNNIEPERLQVAEVGFMTEIPQRSGTLVIVRHVFRVLLAVIFEHVGKVREFMVQSRALDNIIFIVNKPANRVGFSDGVSIRPFDPVGQRRRFVVERDLKMSVPFQQV